MNQKETITYNKLVRDNIPSIIAKDHKSCNCRTLNEEEYLLELNKKLAEELKEYEESQDILELVDIQEIIDAILKTKGISKEEFLEMQNHKKQKNGSFDKKIFLIDVTKED